MLQTMLTTIIAFPLALGVAIAFLSRRFLNAPAILALLVPLSAVAIFIVLEGVPAFPPVRAVHKLPYVFAVGSVVLAAAAWRFRSPSTVFAAAAALIGLGLPVWWIGKNILASNNQKLVVTLALVSIAVAGVIWSAVQRKTNDEAQNFVLPQAVFATLLATALVAILGGYMGMAMFNGALTALFGGYLLVSYIRHLRGDGAAFALSGISGLAFAWIAYLGLLTTAMLAPVASSAALIAVGLTLVLVPLSSIYTRRFSGVAISARPLVYGLVAAVPAIAGILIAGLQFSG